VVSTLAKEANVKKGITDETELAKILCLVATYSRVMHTFFFMTFPLTGAEPRTMAFDGFFFAALGLGVYVAMLAA